MGRTVSCLCLPRERHWCGLATGQICRSPGSRRPAAEARRRRWRRRLGAGGRRARLARRPGAVRRAASRVGDAKVKWSAPWVHCGLGPDLAAGARDDLLDDRQSEAGPSNSASRCNPWLASSRRAAPAMSKPASLSWTKSARALARHDWRGFAFVQRRRTARLHLRGTTMALSRAGTHGP